ncbi:MAG: DUF3987 domain-containing protein [Polyangiales bacterium]
MSNGRPTVDASPPVDPAPSKFPLQIFPPDLQRYARTVAMSTETPVDAVAFAVLGMLSACYGTHIRVRLFEGYTTWCNEYCTLVGGSSFGKTPIFKHVQRPLRAIERVLQEEMAVEVREAKAKIARLEADHARLLKTYKGENPAGLEADLRDIDEEIETLKAVTMPQVIVSDVTPEVLVKIQSQNGDAASMVSGETPLWGKLCGRATGKPPDIEPYLSSYDGERYRVDRITRAANCVEQARLSILGGTQDAVMHAAHARPELSDRGLFARFSFCKVAPPDESQLHDDETPVGHDVRMPYENRLEELGLLFRRKAFEPFELSPEAKTLYRVWRNCFKREHKLPNGALRDIAPFARKLENKVLRWAGLLHPLWNGEVGVLTQMDVERAILLVDFTIENFRAVDALVNEGPVTSLVSALTLWSRDKVGQTISLRDLRRQRTDYRRATPETRQAALDELEADGVVKLETLLTGGRPSPVMVVL